MSHFDSAAIRKTEPAAPKRTRKFPSFSVLTAKLCDLGSGINPSEAADCPTVVKTAPAGEAKNLAAGQDRAITAKVALVLVSSKWCDVAKEIALGMPNVKARLPP